jgi:pimeloyl-ACP methyl ester carboxylesterase
MKSSPMRYMLLFFFLFMSLLLAGQTPYGNNPAAGKYYKLKDGTKIYYEVYGKGKPFVLLHGGVYGYIDEFEPFISKLAEHYQVICIATRGHGKSEIGQAVFTWEQRADDAFQVIRSITSDSVHLLGFSDGGFSAYKLAALHPSLVKRMISIGASDRGKTVQREKVSYNRSSLLAQSKEFFEGRLSLMPQPERWDDALGKLNHLYNDEFLSSETFEKIQCPVLLMSGDRDEYHTVEGMIKAYRSIKAAQLSVIPGCDHVVFFCNFPAVWAAIEPFLKLD